jgi:BirA family biotin operon repressor/biotin-[acetyl-CoA-carboxylase] ligase
LAPAIQFVTETGSTNADLLTRLAAGEGLTEGTWLVADRQSAGRGRQGRRWLDAPGNFTGSTLVRLAKGDPPAASLSFVAALALYEAALARLPEPGRLRLKWPNDLELDRGKLAGILLEREGVHAVIGFGVNLAAAPAVPDRAVRSLAQHGPAPDRDAFAAALAHSFAKELTRWRTYGAEPILARWLAAAHPPGTPLAVHDAGGAPIHGTFAGLEPDGALRLSLADGTSRVIHAGDVEAGVA